MPGYKLSKQAAADLESIMEYTDDMHGPYQTVKYAEGLEKCFETIASNPAIGMQSEDYPGYRRFLHGKHIIYYEVENEAVLIVHIVHGRVHPDSHF